MSEAAFSPVSTQMGSSMSGPRVMLAGSCCCWCCCCSWWWCEALSTSASPSSESPFLPMGSGRSPEARAGARPKLRLMGILGMGMPKMERPDPESSSAEAVPSSSSLPGSLICAYMVGVSPVLVLSPTAEVGGLMVIS